MFIRYKNFNCSPMCVYFCFIVIFLNIYMRSVYDEIPWVLLHYRHYAPYMYTSHYLTQNSKCQGLVFSLHASPVRAGNFTHFIKLLYRYAGLLKLFSLQRKAQGKHENKFRTKVPIYQPVFELTTWEVAGYHGYSYVT